MKLPVVVGVTGHRDLREKDLPELRKAVREELNKIKVLTPHCEHIMLNSIASGGDTLCAEAGLEVGFKLVAALPMDPESFRETFDERDRAKFDELLAKAEKHIVTPVIEPVPENPNNSYYYRQNGIYLAQNCHVLLALWNGTPGKETGCGTAEAVGFALKESFVKKSDCFTPTNEGAVIHIVTPREKDEIDLKIEVSLIEHEEGSLAEILRLTEECSSDLEGIEGRDDGECGELPSEIREIGYLRSGISALAAKYQKKYYKTLKISALLGVSLVLCFLLYDEMNSGMFLLIMAACIAVFAGLDFISTRREYYEKYLRYRVFSEALRVQIFLTAAGVDENVAKDYSWTQKRETTWIKAAISALIIGMDNVADLSPEQVKAPWIDGQLNYHKSALVRNEAKLKKSETTAKVVLYASLAFIIGAIVFEMPLRHLVEGSLFDIGNLPRIFIPLDGGDFSIHSVILVSTGALSAVSAFLSNYFDKLSLDRKCKDNESMIALYSKAKELYDSNTVSKDELFRELAREEICENGSWYAYSRNNSTGLQIF